MSGGNGGNDGVPGTPEVEEAFVRGLTDAARRNWNPPPETPTEEIWAGIREARDGRSQAGKRGDGIRRVPRPKPWWIGIAAALALGVALGRLAERPADLAEPAGALVVADDAATSAAEQAEGLPYRLAAGDLLDRSETFLTMVRAEGASGESLAEVREWAGPLLTRTRLLLGSPAAADPELRALLDDLEIVLAQIAQLRTADAEELGWIDDGMDRSHLLFRLRAASAAGGTGAVRL